MLYREPLGNSTNSTVDSGHDFLHNFPFHRSPFLKLKLIIPSLLTLNGLISNSLVIKPMSELRYISLLLALILGCSPLLLSSNVSFHDDY